MKVTILKKLYCDFGSTRRKISKILEDLVSAPTSQAFVERIFSLSGIMKWKFQVEEGTGCAILWRCLLFLQIISDIL